MDFCIGWVFDEFVIVRYKVYNKGRRKQKFCKILETFCKGFKILEQADIEFLQSHLGLIKINLNLGMSQDNISENEDDWSLLAQITKHLSIREPNVYDFRTVAKESASTVVKDKTIYFSKKNIMMRETFSIQLNFVGL